MTEETTVAPAPQKQRKTPQPVTAAPDAAIPVATDERRRAFGQLFGTEYLHGFQDPVIFREVDFYSPAVQQSYKRDFALISRTLFAEYIYRRRLGYNQEVLDSFSNMCAHKLAAINELLSRNLSQIHKLCQTQGAPIDAAYMDVQHKVVPIIHAFAFQYLRCLQTLDRLLQATGSAVLWGVFTAEQRKTAELTARKAINAFSAMVRNESGKVRREARRVREAASAVPGEDDKEIQAAEQMLAEVHEAYDKENSGSGSDAANAGAEISAMNATSKAAETLAARAEATEPAAAE